MFHDKKMKPCQLHQQKTVRKYITKYPKTEAALELKEIVDLLTKTDKESFEGMFGVWCSKWDDYLKERTTDSETGKSHFTHKKLRSAYLSVKRNLPIPFTWYDNIEMGIPNTTDLIDGYLSQLKRMLRNHNGMKRKRRNKLVIVFFESSMGIIANGSPFIGIKPCRLFLEELLPSRAPLRFIDGAKVQTLFHLTKFLAKKQPNFCPLHLFLYLCIY